MTSHGRPSRSLTVRRACSVELLSSRTATVEAAAANAPSRSPPCRVHSLPHRRCGLARSPRRTKRVRWPSDSAAPALRGTPRGTNRARHTLATRASHPDRPSPAAPSTLVRARSH
eukprot:scaffold8798_cov101-Phaeocystis_antarctica.AAC.3